MVSGSAYKINNINILTSSILSLSNTTGVTLIDNNAGDNNSQLKLRRYAISDGTTQGEFYIDTGNTTTNIYANVGNITSTSIRDDTTGSSANFYIDTISGRLQRSTCSRRYKSNIKNINEDTSKIFNINLKQFDHCCSKHYDIGLIAEEVYEQFPSMILKNNNNEIESIDYNQFFLAMFNELKKIKEEITLLKSS